jgi:cyanophycinase
MGGGNDRDSWAADPFKWFVQQADSGKIINIDVDPVAASYATTFISFGADSTSTSLRIPSRSAADDSTTYKELITAKGIFIEGGDQWDYVREWKGTLVEDALYYIFSSGGVIGGTSAGCAVLGAVDFDAKYGGLGPEDAAYDPYYNRIHLEDDFLNMIPDVLTDSHFHDRGRIGRLIPMLARRIQDHGETGLMGVGVTIKTALCIDPNGIASCYGDGAVSILFKTEESVIICQSGQPVTFSHVHMDQLIHGSRYDLNSRILIDPGPYLAEVDTTLPQPVFKDTLLDGSNENTANLGEVVITRLTNDDLNAWRGNLFQTSGSGIVPYSVIIPKIWNDSDFVENRWVGGMFGVVTHPGYFVLYLDDPSQCTIDVNGRFNTGTLAYILDTYEVTHAGILGARSTNYGGFIGARLHFLSHGDSLELAERYTGVSKEDQKKTVPEGFLLSSNYPNPFNNITTFRFYLPEADHVQFVILNSRGQRVLSLLNEEKESGWHTIHWEAGNLASGIYIVKLSWKDQILSRKVLLVR